jgi:DNA-binding transcriptional LysR family regulator
LFEKAGRGIRLTAAGKTLLKWARQMRADMEDAGQEIADIGRGMAGHVRVGIVPTAAQFLLPAATRQLLAEAPEVTLRTVVGLIDALKPMLRAGELDMVVGTESAPDDGFVSRVVAEDRIVVAASTDHEIFRTQPRLRDLVRYRWVLQPPGAPTRDWLDHTFDRKRLPRPNVQIESSMLLVLPSLLADTGLLSFVSRYHLGADQRASALREVVLPEATMRRRLVVMHRAHRYISPAMQRFIELLAGAGRQWPRDRAKDGRGR